MSDILSFLKQLIQLPGLSGQEAPVRMIIEDKWRPLVDELHTSKLGSLHALRRATIPRPALESRPSILLAAHMDGIGLMVRGSADGFLRLVSIGGLDPRVLPGQRVIVHAQKDLPGVIVQPPAFLLPPGTGAGVVNIEHLLVDTGLPAGEIEKLVRVGDLVSFAQEPIAFGDEHLVGHTLDNRASVAAVTTCLSLLKGRQTDWDVWAVATVQEEVSLAGAITSTYALRPSLAVAIDVTFASGPGSPESKTYPLGKGITLGWGPNIHPGLFKECKKLADELEIPYKLEPLPGHSGTDAIGMQVAAEGVPTMVISIPLRYMHTPVEMVAMKDIDRAGRLLVELITRLELDFMDRLTWDE
jgi:tetrahedral aminopeptidase